MVNPQHVQNIETLNRAQNLSLLSPTEDRVDALSDTDTPTISSPTDSLPVGGELEPSANIAAPPSTTTRTVDQRKPSKRARDIMV